MAFYPLAQSSELHDGYQKSFSVAGRPVVLLQHQGKVYLVANRCPHMDAPLHDAQLVDGGGIRCIAHGIEFDLVSGEAKGPLAGTLDCLTKYTVSYRGNVVGVEI